MRNRTPHRQWNDAGNRIPVRTCVACRARRPQAELWRIVRLEGVLGPDPARSLPGRGAYVCADRPECWKAKALGRFARLEAPALSIALQSLEGNFAPADTSN